MLTYFLEGEDASQRKRRISTTKLQRTNSPHSPDNDPSQAIFGKSTIHPKYWPNGSAISEVPNSEEAIYNCDNQILESSQGSSKICDTNLDKNRAYHIKEQSGLSLPSPPACVSSPLSYTDNHPWSTCVTPVNTADPNTIFLQKSQSDNFMQRNHSEVIGLNSSVSSNQSNHHFNGVNNTNSLKITKPERLPLLNETNL